MTEQLAKVRLFQSLSKEELALLKTHLHEKHFQKGEIIHFENALCHKVFFVHTGKVKLYKTAPDGKQQILESLSVGDSCACNPAEKEWTCNTTAEALEASQVLFLTRDRYIELIQSNPRVCLGLNRILADKLRCFGSLIGEIALIGPKKRIARFLLDMFPLDSSLDNVSVGFTRQEMANHVGIARETFIRHLQELQKLRIIQVKAKKIQIRDRGALEGMLK